MGGGREGGHCTQTGRRVRGEDAVGKGGVVPAQKAAHNGLELFGRPALDRHGVHRCDRWFFLCGKMLGKGEGGKEEER